MTRKSRKESSQASLVLVDGAILFFRSLVTQPIATSRKVLPGIQYGLAMRAFYKKDYACAAARLEKLLRKYPKSPTFLEALGNCQRKLGKNEVARETSREANQLKKREKKRCAHGACRLS